MSEDKYLPKSNIISCGKCGKEKILGWQCWNPIENKCDRLPLDIAVIDVKRTERELFKGINKGNMKNEEEKEKIFECNEKIFECDIISEVDETLKKMSRSVMITASSFTEAEEKINELYCEDKPKTYLKSMSLVAIQNNPTGTFTVL